MKLNDKRAVGFESEALAYLAKGTNDRFDAVFGQLFTRYRLFLISDKPIFETNLQGIDPLLFDPLECRDSHSVLDPFGYASEALYRRPLCLRPNIIVYVATSMDGIVQAEKRLWSTIHASDIPSPQATAHVNALAELEGLLL